MRIGQFAEINHTSIDTIRHYMQMSLLIPQKTGAQYDFDAQCQSDYENVCFLKEMGFVLADIQMLLQYQRLGQLTDYDKRAPYQAFFRNKQEELSAEIDKLNARQACLSTYIEHISTTTEHPQSGLGVPLDALSLLRCPACKSILMVENAQVTAGQVVSGALACRCGEKLMIEEGVLIGKDAMSRDYIHGDHENFIDEYIKKTDTAYQQKLVRGLKWSKVVLPFDTFEKCVLLELGSGYGFFLRHFADALPATAIYVAVDHDLQSLMWLKQQLERNPPRCKLLFVCADFQSVPLPMQSVDLLLDISGSSNYAFEHETFLLDRMMPYMKDSSLLHGYYILFDNFVSHSKIGLPHRHLFIEKQVRQAILQAGFEELEAYVTEPVSNGGPMEDYFVEGERVYSLFFHGRHRGKNGVNPTLSTISTE